MPGLLMYILLYEAVMTDRPPLSKKGDPQKPIYALEDDVSDDVVQRATGTN